MTMLQFDSAIGCWEHENKLRVSELWVVWPMLSIGSMTLPSCYSLKGQDTSVGPSYCRYLRCNHGGTVVPTQTG